MTDITGLLRDARARGVDRLDALVLLEHVWHRPRVWLMAHGDEPVPPDVDLAVTAALIERSRGMPLAYLVGTKSFHEIDLEVSPAVLVPRPETELLVEWALERLRSSRSESSAPVVVDLGTGSGAIALALKRAYPRAEIHAVDASQAALDVARRNAHRLGLHVAFWHGDWWQGGWIARIDRSIDVAVSNPPYIAVGDPHLRALSHEPTMALIAGVDGLDAIRAVVADAGRHLSPRGALLLEHGFDQGAAVRRLLEEAGLSDIDTRQDLAGHDRCSGGVR